MSQNSQLKARQRRLNIRLSAEEWDKVHKLAGNTTCRSVSDYARKVLAQKPVKVFYRNKSFDEFEERMSTLLPQLETDRETFALLVKKLSSLYSTPEINAALQEVLAAQQSFSLQATCFEYNILKLSRQCDQK